MAISPRTQAMLEKRAEGSPDEFFEEGFRELALHRLMSQMPDLAERIVALKILDTDIETDSAVGTFIITQGEDEVHIPAVLAENVLAPFDIMYVKSLDQFLPLSEDWLIELERMDAARMGQAVDTPERLRSDQDIRNVVVPPTTGRYSYASHGGKLLPAYLSEAHNMVKESFLKTLDKHPKIAQFVFTHYEYDDIKDAIRPHAEKTAAVSTPVNFVTIETPVTETREIFGKDSPRAAREIAEKGYAAKDDRDSTNKLVADEEGPLSLQVPDMPGFYRIFLTDGTSPSALVFPKVLTAEGMYQQQPLGVGISTTRGVTKQCRMAVTDDGRFINTKNDFVAQPLELGQVSDKLKNIVKQKNARTPRNGQRGFFCDPDSKSLTALEPVKIEFVTTKDGTRFIQGYTYSGDYVNITQIKDSPIRKPKALSGRNRDTAHEYVSCSFKTKKERDEHFYGHGEGDVILVPWHYKFIPLSKIIQPRQLLRDASAVTAMFYDSLTQSGAERIRLKNADMGQLAWGTDLLSPFEAVKKLATVYGVNVGDAEYAVKVAAEQSSSCDFYVVSPQVESAFRTRVKKAYGMPEEGMMPPEEEMDPGMAGPSGAMPPEIMMDPAMMGPPPPPPPSPVELAAQEIMDQVMQSGQEVMNQLITQKQSLETQMGVLQAVVQRAGQIEAEQHGFDAGEPVMAPPTEAPPPPPSGDPAAEMGAPTPGEMAPDMGGGMPMEGGGMPIEEPHSMEQAMQLQDPELFDTAAVASLAEQNEFDHAISQFMPVFQEALDALGRMLMEIRMKSYELKEKMGDTTYTEISDTAETLFGRLGELVIRLNEVVIGVPSE